jgi:heme oxygenase
VTESSVALPPVQGSVAHKCARSVQVSNFFIEDRILTSRAIDRLRQETRAVHSDLDESLHLIDRLGARLKRAGVMAGYHRFHHALEAAVAPFLAGIADLDFYARRRAQLIADGIALLGGEVSPDRAPSPGLSTRSEALGALYVMEGSSLGGRVILKELTRGGVSLAGLGFLDPYGSDAGPRWRSFLAILEREVHSGEQRDDAVSGALNAFAFAKLCLCKESTH